MGLLSEWELVRNEPLGQGGQSTVYLVRRPERRKAREESFTILNRHSMAALERKNGEQFARASYDISRPELPQELGALKKFHLRAGGHDPERSMTERLQNEISVLKQGKNGFLKLLAFNDAEKWIVTEYCEQGTLDRHLQKYRGNALVGLKAIIPLIRTVAELHESANAVFHRDIKPQNIFIGSAGELLLGDFGLVFMPDAPDHPTFTGETVGPRDFMPPWVLGIDHPKITAAFDVYMLGKVLWCMISGRQKLYREDFTEEHLDLTRMFPDKPEMHGINQILKKSVVRYERDCEPNARTWLTCVNALAAKLERGGQIVRDEIPISCRVCGEGTYITEDAELNPTNQNDRSDDWQIKNGRVAGERIAYLHMKAMVCDRCGNIQLFKKT